MIMSKYYRVHNGANKNSWMVEEKKVDYLRGKHSHFVSTCYYTQEQYEKFQKTKSVAGIHDVKTNNVWFDFDSHEALDLPKADAIELVQRLNKAGFSYENIQIYFSAGKGFHVFLRLNNDITPAQVKKVVTHFGDDLKTLDKKIYDAARIMRAPNTKHEKTGLYKIELSANELQTLNIEQIKELARAPRDEARNIALLPAELPQELLLKENKSEVFPKENIQVDPNDPLKIKEIDFSSKPHGWKDYKWALAQGRFEIGNRNHSMMVIASTCRALKYGYDHTEAFCLAADKLHCEITGDEPMNDFALEKQVLSVVFGSTWNGGQYSPENDIQLREYCKKHGFDTNSKEASSKTIEITDAFQIFTNFKKNKSKFVVDTGIHSLNKLAKMTIGQVVGIVAAPSVGKSTLGLQILNVMSKKGNRCLFFSYDMYIALVVQKLMQKHTNLSEVQIDHMIASMSPDEEKEILGILKEEYGNVGICFESGQSVEDIINTLKAEREKNEEVNLVVIDYNELIVSQNSDSTEASKEVAQKLRSMANTYNVCVVVLMQPNKISGGPSDEIKSYRAIKGSSMAEQGVDIALGLSRPGFDPQFPEDDRFLVINCLKNRYGGLFRLELLFDGYNGTISEITNPEDKLRLEEVKNRRKAQQLEENDGFGGFRK